ncbi:MAG: preprotein translocase subunit SecE [Chloroflexi bacterium]|nr:preprotein translocase subunit SecE [Chloroflexota bacterium]
MGVARVAKTKTAVSENKLQRFAREIKSELKKVVWPSRQEATNLTMVVIGFSVAVGMFLGGVDWLFQKIFALIIGGV